MNADCDVPLANSTKYVVTIPAGITSYLGDATDKEYGEEFLTPTIRVTQLQPSYGQVTVTPIFMAVFDQVVDQEEVLKCISFYSEGIIGNTHIKIVTNKSKARKTCRLQSLLLKRRL